MVTVLLSDLHLGGPRTDAAGLVRFLSAVRDGRVPCERLLIVGDLFDKPRVVLSPLHRRVLRTIRELPCERLWLLGNHDPVGHRAADVAAECGMNFARHTTVAAGGHRWWVTHGDQFDAVISDQPTLVSAADAGYGVLQRLSAAVAGWAKRSCKTFLRAVEAVREQAVAEALRRGCVGAVCGHTHVAESSDGYLNTGSWVTPDRPTYAVADEAGLRLEWWWDEGRNAGA